MKMRRTLYPVTVAIAVPIVIIVFIILNQGHFKQVSSTLLESKQTMESYFIWKGFGKPNIQSVKLDEEHNTKLVSLHSSVESVEENATESMKEVIEKHHPMMSIQLEADGGELQGNSEIVIYYTIFGIDREEKLEVET